MASIMILVPVLALPWKVLATLALYDDQSSQIGLGPLIAAALIFRQRQRIFGYITPAWLSGGLLGLTGVTLTILPISLRPIHESIYGLSISTIGATVTVIGDFLLCFGPMALRRAGFALGFLFLIVPIPRPLMRVAVVTLQNGSAACTAMLFRLIRLPFSRAGLTFSLPGVDIEIAEQCSGIRSTIALFIASLLTTYLFLRAWWRRTLIVLMTVPLAVFRNAVRIVTISALGIYVSPRFFTGRLHHYSGLPFSLLELVVLAPIVTRWYRAESCDS